MTPNFKNMDLPTLWAFRNEKQLRIPNLRELITADVRRQQEVNIPLDELLQIPCGRNSFTTYTSEFVKPFREAVALAWGRANGREVVIPEGDLNTMSLQQLADLQFANPDRDQRPVSHVVMEWLYAMYARGVPSLWKVYYQRGATTRGAKKGFEEGLRTALKQAFWLRHVADETSWSNIAGVIQKENLSLQELVTLNTRLIARNDGKDIINFDDVMALADADVGRNPKPQFLHRDGMTIAYSETYRDAFAQLMLSGVCKIMNPPRG